MWYEKFYFNRLSDFRPDILFQYRLREKNTRFLVWTHPRQSPGCTRNKISERRESQFDQYGHSSIQKLEDKRKNTHSGRRKYRQPSNLTFFRHPEYHTARQRPVDFKERSRLPNSLQKVQLRMKRTCSLNEQWCESTLVWIRNGHNISFACANLAKPLPTQTLIYRFLLFRLLCNGHMQHRK